MTNQIPVSGFSKLTRDQKIQWLAEASNDPTLKEFLKDFRIPDEKMQTKFESFSENTLSNFHLPWGIVPNVLIDSVLYHVPVVVEESSVVAAASKAAAFWSKRGGFETLFTYSLKKGQLHVFFYGDHERLRRNWKIIAERLRQGVSALTENMVRRGGGIAALHLRKITGMPDQYFQVDMDVKTADSMGANFINSIMEEMGRILPGILQEYTGGGQVEVLMGILSNYTPESIIKMKVQAPVRTMQWDSKMDPEAFCRRMKLASDIAKYDRSRAVTHNKGIFNGVDAVIIATGNDFRAVEANGHAYASRKSSRYSGLSTVTLENNIFNMELDIPLALGTVGGLTNLHPMAEKSLALLGNPDSRTLMKIVAAVGLASNFAAMASLVTTGIQKGHMRMHMKNILNSLAIPEKFHDTIEDYFSDKSVSVSAVREYAQKLK